MDLNWALDHLYQYPWLPVATGLLIVFVGLIAIQRLLASGSDFCPEDVPNTVILYQFQRGPYAPSFSPYCLKLETYLRMANIPYQNVHGMKKSSKGKIPWIRYNGVSKADSQFCIDFLNKKFDVDLNFRLDRANQAVARAFSKLLEESLTWYMIIERWLYNQDKPWMSEAGIPRLVRWFIGRKVRTAAYYQGMGRHTREELHDVMRKDIEALSAFLGSKKFLMGYQPSEVDCIAFSLITQLTVNMSGSIADVFITEKHPELLDYCDRMRRRFWPDWEECTTRGGKTKTTK
ncbi:failed axon connections homolog [Liolophura sinensis]|uniref:failed axon connections homolog n=1 Tax=Liolophura sinensis TaxID=3198878 RepID=UPI003157FA6F